MGGRPAGGMERKEGEAYRGRAWSEGVLEGGRDGWRQVDNDRTAMGQGGMKRK